MQNTRQLKLMGTTIDLLVVAPNSSNLLDEAENLLHLYNHRFSANDDTSELSLVNSKAGIEPVSVHPELFELIAIGKNHSCADQSNLNIAIGPLVQTWRIGFSDAQLPSESEISKKLPLTDPQQIILDPKHQTVFLAQKGMKIDLGALAKGYIADKVMAYLVKAGASSAMVNLGGNLLVHGSNPNRDNHLWYVGIQHPDKPRGNHATILPIQNASVVTSGIYERVLTIGDKKYHHIFDRKTGYPIETDMASLTIIAKSSLDCEIWTTRLFGLPTSIALQIINQTHGIEGLIITKSLEILTSKNIR